jgi:hypothetical protein
MRSLSPRYLDASDADDTLKNEHPHSVATAGEAQSRRGARAASASVLRKPQRALGSECAHAKRNTACAHLLPHGVATRTSSVPRPSPSPRQQANARHAPALASMVLPVPGGPNIMTPLTGRRMPVKNSGMIMGSTVASSRTRLASARPAMSLHLREGARERGLGGSRAARRGAARFRHSPFPESLAQPRARRRCAPPRTAHSACLAASMPVVRWASRRDLT